jgi:hypothetical protein
MTLPHVTIPYLPELPADFDVEALLVDAMPYAGHLESAPIQSLTSQSAYDGLRELRQREALGWDRCDPPAPLWMIHDSFEVTLDFSLDWPPTSLTRAPVSSPLELGHGVTTCDR